MPDIYFGFSLRQLVNVKPIGMLGTIDAMMCDNNSTQYRVVYWNDGSRHSVWMYDWEIEGYK